MFSFRSNSNGGNGSSGWEYTQRELDMFRNDPVALRLSNPKFRGMFINSEGKIVAGSKREVISIDRAPAIILETYKNTSLGRDKLISLLNMRYHGIPRRLVEQVLFSNTTHAVHQPLPNMQGKVSQPIISTRPLARLQIDLTDMNASQNALKKHPRYRYILVAQDHFSKHVWVRALAIKSAEVVSRELKSILDEIKSSTGLVPSVIQSDNGSEFLAQTSAMLESYSIKQIFSSSHTPQTQGMIERFNRTLKNRIAQYLKNHPEATSWFDALAPIVDAYNSSEHSTTKAVPRAVLPKGANADADAKADAKVVKADAKVDAKAADETEREEKVHEIDEPVNAEVEADVNADADNAKNERVRSDVEKNIRENAKNMILRTEKKFVKLKIGDYVRVSNLTHAAQRSLVVQGQRKNSSKANWSEDVYQIQEIVGGQKFSNTKDATVYSQKFKLVDLQGNPVDGKFYRNRLLKVPPPLKSAKQVEISANKLVPDQSHESEAVEAVEAVVESPKPVELRRSKRLYNREHGLVA